MRRTAGKCPAIDTAISPELIARFRAEIERAGLKSERFGLAVSGGPDSLAMLLLAQAAFPDQFEVATVDHGLREAAKDECAFVAQVCQQRDIPCAVLTVKVTEGNLQAQARAARYAALENWASNRGLAAIFTAHHADDQAETLMMRLNRGSGVAGLAGVRSVSEIGDQGLRIVRPLLGFRREELARVVEASGLEAVQDPSNEDTRFDRVRIRQALAEADWLDTLAVTQSAQHLADANDALDYAAERFWEENARRDGGAILLPFHPMRATRLQLMARAISELGGNPRGSDLARLDDGLPLLRKGNVAGVMVELRMDEGVSFLIFSPEPPRNS